MTSTREFNAWTGPSYSGDRFLDFLFSAIDLTAPLCGSAWRQNNNRC